MERRGSLVPGQSLGGVAAALVDSYSGGISEAAQASDNGWRAVAHCPQSTQSVHMGPACPVLWLHNRAGVAEAGGVISYEGKGDLDPRLHPSRAKATTAGTCPEYIRENAGLCLQPAQL